MVRGSGSSKQVNPAARMNPASIRMFALADLGIQWDMWNQLHFMLRSSSSLHILFAKFVLFVALRSALSLSRLCLNSEEPCLVVFLATSSF